MTCDRSGGSVFVQSPVCQWFQTQDVSINLRLNGPSYMIWFAFHGLGSFHDLNCLSLFELSFLFWDIFQDLSCFQDLSSPPWFEPPDSDVSAAECFTSLFCAKNNPNLGTRIGKIYAFQWVFVCSKVKCRRPWSTWTISANSGFAIHVFEGLMDVCTARLRSWQIWSLVPSKLSKLHYKRIFCPSGFCCLQGLAIYIKQIRLAASRGEPHLTT